MPFEIVAAVDLGAGLVFAVASIGRDDNFGRFCGSFAVGLAIVAVIGITVRFSYGA